jgi:hypothetical protein
LLDEKKQPYADRQPYVSGNRVTALIGLYMKLVVIPGTSRTLMSNEEHFEGIIMNQVDPDRYRDVKTDATGRMTFPTLIPDAPYAIVDGFHVKDEFRAKSGENVQLPDLVLTKP